MFFKSLFDTSGDNENPFRIGGIGFFCVNGVMTPITASQMLCCYISAWLRQKGLVVKHQKFMTMLYVQATVGFLVIDLHHYDSDAHMTLVVYDGYNKCATKVSSLGDMMRRLSIIVGVP